MSGVDISIFFFYLWCFSIPLELLDGVVMWQCSKLDSQTFPWWSWEDRLQYCQNRDTEVSHDCSSLCKSTIKTWDFKKLQRSEWKCITVLRRFRHYFIVSSWVPVNFLFFSQRLLPVAFDVRWVFSLVGSDLKPNCINLHACGTFSICPFTIHIWETFRFFFFLPGYTKTIRIGSFRHLEWTCGLFWQKGLQLML